MEAFYKIHAAFENASIWELLFFFNIVLPVCTARGP